MRKNHYSIIVDLERTSRKYFWIMNWVISIALIVKTPRIIEHLLSKAIANATAKNHPVAIVSTPAMSYIIFCSYKIEWM
ncbi:MAG: hypothetical protein ACRAVC_07780 [Trichormus sp.]